MAHQPSARQFRLFLAALPDLQLLPLDQAHHDAVQRKLDRHRGRKPAASIGPVTQCDVGDRPESDAFRCHLAYECAPSRCQLDAINDRGNRCEPSTDTSNTTTMFG